ncbi:MAG: amidohydrolase family protein [Bryobacteraceae bacterium]
MRAYGILILLTATLAVPLLEADEHGALTLYFLQLPVGEEAYQVTTEANGALTLHASFEYTERGSRVPLSATLRMKPDLTPLQFEAKGKSYRPFSVDAAVQVNPDGRTAIVREGDKTRQAALPARFFTISGYAPFSVQMMLLRYWAGHGKPARLAQLPAEAPGTEALIEVTGQDTIDDGGKPVRLTRYSVGNVVWGNETVWLNENGEIAGGVGYAGGLPLEAIRKEYRLAFSQLIRSAVADRLKELAAAGSRIQPLVKGEFAIAGATLIDGTGATPVPDAVVVVKDGRIAAAGARSQVTVPKGMPVIDGSGATLLPGLWEMHAHFAQVEWGPAYLAAGVTTARDCGGEFEFITSVRDLIESGSGLGPRLVLAGLVDRSGTGTFGVNWADTPAQGRAQVARYKAAGFVQMKIYSRIQPDVLAAIATEAHRQGMSVTGHVPEGMTAIQAVEAGMDQINHFGPVYQEVRRAGEGRERVIQFFKDHHTVVDPTMAWGELLGRPMNVDIASFEPGFAKAPYTLTSVIGTAGTPPTNAPQSGRLNDQFAVLHALYTAGIPIVAGTDKAVPGHSVHRELELYVQAGLTPMEVIQLATSGAAKVMHMDEEVGTVEAGKRADLILVQGNPLEDFANLRKVMRVVTKGRMYDPAELWKSVGFRPAVSLSLVP